MKKILSIFMVAVLSLNLLCQPCEAAHNEMGGGSPVPPQNQKVGYVTSEEFSYEKDKTTRPQSLMWRAIKFLVNFFIGCALCSYVARIIYDAAFEAGRKEGNGATDPLLEVYQMNRKVAEQELEGYKKLYEKLKETNAENEKLIAEKEMLIAQYAAIIHKLEVQMEAAEGRYSAFIKSLIFANTKCEEKYEQCRKLSLSCCEVDPGKLFTDEEQGLIATDVYR